METLVIQAKTKLQAKTIKALSDAMGMKYKSMEEIERLEDEWMGKLIAENETGEIIEGEEFQKFKKETLKK